MENNNNYNNIPNYSKSVCEKILSAIRVSPAFKTIRRISPFRPRETTTTNPSLTTQNHDKKSIEIQTKISTAPQKSNFGDQNSITITPYLPPLQKKGKVGQNKDQEQHTNKAKKKLDLNETFSEYIKQTREKIRTSSDVGKSTLDLGFDGVHESKRIEGVKDHPYAKG